MLEDVGKLLPIIQKNYDTICRLWDEKKQISLNLKKKLVKDIRNNSQIFESIVTYRSLINDEMPNILFSLNSIPLENSIVTSRVKAQNSIEYKIENYIKNHQNGNIPIKKCFNDLLGIRLVIEGDFAYADVKAYMQENFPNYKCIDSSKKEYIASHIYFEESNYYFPWELQIWNKNNEAQNYLSHKYYKQDYTQWERINRGGVSDD
ncbi:MAG: hypothetical protein ACI4HI_11895 [Lachnospiraceae bacterium]